MALFLRQDEQRSEVQKRVAAEMQERLREKAKISAQESEPAALDGQHQTRSAGMTITVLLLLLAGAIFLFAIRIS